jgi:hypothetical protein
VPTGHNLCRESIAYRGVTRQATGAEVDVHIIARRQDAEIDFESAAAK